MIKITVSKKVNRGRRFYHITAIDAPMRDELPYEYIEGRPATWRERGALVIQDDKGKITQLNLGDAYMHSDLEERWAIVEKCVKRFSQVLKDQEELNKDWQGETVFLANVEK